MYFSKNLKYLRLKHNLTLREMGDILGVSHEMIAKYEKKKPDKLKNDKVEAIVAHFKITEHDLIYSDIEFKTVEKRYNLNQIQLNEPIVEYQKPQKISFDPMQMDRIESMLVEVLRLLKEK